jgi:acyl-CoA synthetase (AMP-forming)/AMP-acid ligase II
VRLPELDWLPTAPIVLHRAAAEFGDRDLLVMPDARLTFGEAEARSRTLAKLLVDAGVGKGTRVGMQFSYSVEFVIALLAVTRIGALAAPLSTAYSPAELQGALRRADIDTLLVPPALLGRDELQFLEAAVPELCTATPGHRLACTAAPYLRQVLVLGTSGRSSDRSWASTLDLDHDFERDLERDPVAVSDALVEQIEAEVTPADLLVLIQTSGSTAEPKGVLHTHGAAFRTIATGPVIPGPIFLSMPFFWVGGLLSLWSALHNGATLVCQERFDPAEALDLIEAHRVTLVASWFTVTNALRNHPSVPVRDLACIPALTQDPGGQPYATPLGMTETLGPHMTVPHPEYGMTPPEHLWGSNGITSPFVEHRLVDPETGADIDGDGEGELCVRGHSVTVGMYKREREETFDADGWYHTGDRVARHDGLWWFVGRTTEMVKVRGANVAPAEVEAALESHPDVEHAFVLGLPHPEFEEQVAAVLVARDGTSLDVEQVADAASRLLSRYKIPTVFTTMEEEQVPWLATGKPDKRTMRRMLTEMGSR